MKNKVEICLRNILNLFLFILESPMRKRVYNYYYFFSYQTFYNQLYLIKIYIYLFISYLLNKNNNNNKTTKNYLVTIIHKMSSSSSEEQLMVHLREIEEAAEEVLSDKQEIVDLDRKRCQNREAIRAMSHLNHAGAATTTTSSSSSSSQWLAMGNCFFKSCLKTKPKLYYRKVKYMKK